MQNILPCRKRWRRYECRTVYIDLKRDIAIIRINPRKYKSPGAIPYSIRKTPADLAEPIFTLGFPRNEIVYGKGYVAAKTGYKGDSLALQITIAANQGNSGGPVFNRNGEVVGILTGKQTSAEGAVFALHSRYIYNALNAIRKEILLPENKDSYSHCYERKGPNPAGTETDRIMYTW